MKQIKKLFLHLCLLLFVLEIHAIEYTMQKGVVRASEKGQTIWENVHDRLNRIEKEGKAGPVQSGSFVYYSIGSYLYEVSAQTGAVQKRIVLPGYCKQIEKANEGVRVEVGSLLMDFSWKKNYTITPQSHDVPFYLTSYLSQSAMDRNDAKSLCETILGKSKIKDKADSDSLSLQNLQEKAIEALDAHSKRDPSNLWYIMQQGIILGDLGKKTESLAKFQEVLQSPAEYHLSLLSIVHTLDNYNITLGDEAFEKGMQFLVARGYEPELMNALISVMVVYGRPLREKKDILQDLSYMNKLGERIWTFSPYAEASCYMFHALYVANQKAGDYQKADLWKARKDAATPFRIFGGANIYAEHTGHYLSLLCAISMGMIFLLFVKGIRIPKNKQNRFANLFFFRFWTKGELTGFLILVAIGCYTFYGLLLGIEAIRYAANMPISCLNGFLNHPDAIEYIQKARNTESKEFIYAFALQKAQEEQAADEIYQKLDSAQALNNRGVIAYHRCDREAARLLFQKALDKDPSLEVAAFNLGKRVVHPRIEKMQKYNATIPLLALPTGLQWSNMLASSQELTFPEIFSLMENLDQIR